MVPHGQPPSGCGYRLTGGLCILPGTKHGRGAATPRRSPVSAPAHDPARRGTHTERSDKQPHATWSVTSSAAARPGRGQTAEG